MNMDVLSANYQVLQETAKEKIKEIENSGVTAKAETLEDIRDMKGKSFKTADLVKLMEKYDPEAFAQLKKHATFFDDGTWYHGGLGYIDNWINKIQKGFKNGTISSENTSATSKSNEAGLSDKAQKFLNNLRKQYGDYDFFIGNQSDDLRSLVKSGTKEFSVIFSNAEIERMASDEKYAKEKLQSIEGAVRMSEKINQQYGFERGFGKNGTAGTEITKIGIVFNDDGTTSFFAELEKSSAKQKERIEKSIENKRAEKREEKNKAKKDLKKYSKNSADTKRTTVEADSMENLLKKISKVDWNMVKAQNVPDRGDKYDFSV